MLVVSEETGIVSMARDGVLTRPLTVKALEELLNEIFTVNNSKMFNLLKSIRHEAEGENNE